MKQYLDLLRRIKTEGVVRGDRTGTGTKGVFGHQMRFDLSEGFPLLTTKKVFLKGVIHELLWFLRGDTNIKYLVDNGVHIWDNDAYRHYNELCVRHGVLPVGRETFLASAGVESPIEGYRFGDLNHVYGYQWRSWPRPDGGVVDQIAQAAGLIRTNPESRRIVVSAWRIWPCRRAMCCSSSTWPGGVSRASCTSAAPTRSSACRSTSPPTPC